MTTATIKGITIDKDAILQAIATYDAEGQKPKATKFMLSHNDKMYAPKQIIALATGLSVSQFSGGSASNNPLKKLGFDIVALVPTVKTPAQLLLERVKDASLTDSEIEELNHMLDCIE